MRRYISKGNLRSQQRSHNLSNDSTGSQDGRYHRQGADQRNQKHSRKGCTKGCNGICDKIAKTTHLNHTQQGCCKCHKRKDIAQHHFNGFFPCRIARTDNTAHSHANTKKRIFMRSRLCRNLRLRFLHRIGSGGCIFVEDFYVRLTYIRNIIVFLHKTCQRTALSGRKHIDGRDSLFGIYTTACRSTTINHSRQNLLIRTACGKSVNYITLTCLCQPLRNRMDASSTYT